MGVFNHISFSVKSASKLPDDVKIDIMQDSAALLQFGFNLPVAVSGGAAFRHPAEPPRTMLVMGHFDTGASVTSIDTQLAGFLGLVPVGFSTSHTAAGPSRMPCYAVDVSFPGTSLRPRENLMVGSCKLPFDLEKAKAEPRDARNFGLLIGRDIMARWNVCWNGTTSTVTVGD